MKIKKIEGHDNTIHMNVVKKTGDFVGKMHDYFISEINKVEGIDHQREEFTRVVLVSTIQSLSAHFCIVLDDAIKAGIPGVKETKKRFMSTLKDFYPDFLECYEYLKTEHNKEIDNE